MFLASSRRERRLEEQLVRVNQLLGGQLEDVGMGHLQVPPALVDNIATADEGQNLVTEVAESVAASVSAAISDVVQSTLPQLSGSLPNKSDL